MGYLNKRMKEEDFIKKNNSTTAGPVITISREVGCNGIKLAKLIASRLNSHNKSSNWEVLSKEIYHQSALELNLESDEVRRVFKQSEKYAFDEILKAFSNKNFKSEQQIIKTVVDIVRNSCIDGYSIIVGRAGHIIAGDIENSFHLKLIAPLNYRVQTIQDNNGLNREESVKFINKVEKERIIFRKAIHQEKLDEELFDLTINRNSFNNDDIVDIIVYAINKKGIL